MYLNENPFHMSGVSIESSRADIEAAGAGMLTDPGERLRAEMAWFPEGVRDDISKDMSIRLRKGIMLQDLASGPVGRINTGFYNMSVSTENDSGFTVRTCLKIMEAFTSIDGRSLMEDINRGRARAGIRPVNSDEMAAALDEKKKEVISGIGDIIGSLGKRDPVRKTPDYAGLAARLRGESLSFGMDASVLEEISAGAETASSDRQDLIRFAAAQVTLSADNVVREIAVKALLARTAEWMGYVKASGMEKTAEKDILEVKNLLVETEHYLMQQAGDGNAAAALKDGACTIFGGDRYIMDLMPGDPASAGRGRSIVPYIAGAAAAVAAGLAAVILL